jgi:hypothetical protein
MNSQVSFVNKINQLANKDQTDLLVEQVISKLNNIHPEYKLYIEMLKKEFLADLVNTSISSFQGMRTVHGAAFERYIANYLTENNISFKKQVSINKEGIIVEYNTEIFDELPSQLDCEHKGCRNKCWLRRVVNSKLLCSTHYNSEIKKLKEYKEMKTQNDKKKPKNKSVYKIVDFVVGNNVDIGANISQFIVLSCKKSCKDRWSEDDWTHTIKPKKYILATLSNTYPVISNFGESDVRKIITNKPKTKDERIYKLDYTSLLKELATA